MKPMFYKLLNYLILTCPVIAGILLLITTPLLGIVYLIAYFVFSVGIAVLITMPSHAKIILNMMHRHKAFDDASN